jgi:hypothetical protein
VRIRGFPCGSPARAGEMTLGTIPEFCGEIGASITD